MERHGPGTDQAWTHAPVYGPDMDPGMDHAPVYGPDTYRAGDSDSPGVLLKDFGVLKKNPGSLLKTAGFF